MQQLIRQYVIRTYKNTGNLENIRTCVIWVKIIRIYIAAPQILILILQLTFPVITLTWSSQ